MGDRCGKLCKPGSCERCDEVRAWLDDEEPAPNLDQADLFRARFQPSFPESFRDSAFGVDVGDNDEPERPRRTGPVQFNEPDMQVGGK